MPENRDPACAGWILGVTTRLILEFGSPGFGSDQD